MSVVDQDLYVMMNVKGVTPSTMSPGVSSGEPILVSFDDFNTGQVITTVAVYIYSVSLIRLYSESRDHHPCLYQRGQLRVTGHHPRPLPLLSDPEIPRGRRHIQQLHHLQYRAGVRPHEPGFGETHPGLVLILRP